MGWQAYLPVGKLPGFLCVGKLHCRVREGILCANETVVEGICKVYYFLSDSIVFQGFGVGLAACFGHFDKNQFLGEFRLISLMTVLISLTVSLVNI